MRECLTKDEIIEYDSGNIRLPNGKLPEITDRIREMMEHFNKCRMCRSRYRKYKIDSLRGNDGEG